MEMAAARRPYTLGQADFDLVASLEKHLASIEKHLGAVIRTASKLAVERQEDSWALAQNLQKEIRVARKQMLAAREKKSQNE